MDFEKVFYQYIRPNDTKSVPIIANIHIWNMLSLSLDEKQRVIQKSISFAWKIDSMARLWSSGYDMGFPSP